MRVDSIMFKVKSAVMKFYLLIVLAINATTVDVNYHLLEYDMTKLSYELLIEKCNMRINNRTEI